VDDLNAVLNAVGAERPSLLGSSDAGLMAIQFAATYPERIASLILANTGARVAPAPDDPYGIPTELWEAVERRLPEEWGKEDSGFIDIFWPERATDPELRRWVAKVQRSIMTPKRAVELWRMQRDIDLRNVLYLIQAPTLVVTGSDWTLVPVINSEYLAKNIPDSRLLVLKGRGLVLLVNADEYVDAIEEYLTGGVRSVEPDRVLATILFTDIVGSTQRATELGDKRWKALLDDHDRTIRKQLARYRGREINTVGDGFIATFDGPGRAIQCACAIRDALESLGIEVRAGLHAGEVEIRGDDVAGVAVHTGARVGASADAGEVLVSSTVKDLVAGSGIEFGDRGDHELKGVPGTWHLYAVKG